MLSRNEHSSVPMEDLALSLHIGVESRLLRALKIGLRDLGIGGIRHPGLRVEEKVRYLTSVQRGFQQVPHILLPLRCHTGYQDGEKNGIRGFHVGKDAKTQRIL